jgi:hypothetical protein
MGATGDKPFFDGDGMYAPEARDSFTDPLSGLVGESPAGQDFDRVRIAKPVQPDAEAVREMVNAALREDARSAGAIAPAAPSNGTLTTEFTVANTETGKQPLGMLPQQRNWPSRPPQLLRRKVAAPVEADFEEAEDVRDAAEDAMPRRMPGMSRRPKPSSTSTGVIIAVVLMLVFAIVSIEFLVSLVDGITGLFH